MTETLFTHLLLLGIVRVAQVSDVGDMAREPPIVAARAAPAHGLGGARLIVLAKRAPADPLAGQVGRELSR